MSSTTSPTSTTISAHIDDDIPDIVIRTPQPAPQNRDVTLPSADPATRFSEIECHILDAEDDEEVQERVDALPDLPCLLYNHAIRPIGLPPAKTETRDATPYKVGALCWCYPG